MDGPVNLIGFEGFEGATSRISGVTPSALYGRGGGKGIGINGLGSLVGTSWRFGAHSFSVTVGFAFKNYSDAQWGGSVTLVEVYNFRSTIKGAIALTSQKQLALYSLDDDTLTFELRAISDRAVKDDAWHYIEFVWQSGSSNNGYVAAYVNGQLYANSGGVDTDLRADQDPDPFAPKRGVTNFHIGVLSGFLNESRHMAFDDVYSSVNSVIVGDAKASELELAADDVVELTPVPGPDNFDMVNEDPADDATTYNTHADVGYLEDRFTIVDPDATGSILGVQLSGRMRKTRTALWRNQFFIEVDPYIEYHGGEYLTFDAWTEMQTRVFPGAPGIPDPLHPSYVILHQWTWEEVLAMKVGYVLWPPSYFIPGSPLADRTPATPTFPN